MIIIAVATYAEAKPLIDFYQLKQRHDEHVFSIFSEESASMMLILTGVGVVAASSALSYICTKYGTDDDTMIWNVGICAGSKIGQIYCINKLEEEATGRTFFPDLLFQCSIPEQELHTVSRPVGTEQMEDVLYDMEGTAIIQTAGYFVCPHQIGFLKIVSDFGDTKSLSQEGVTQLILQQMEIISDCITKRQEFFQQLQNIVPRTSSNSQSEETFNRLAADFHCSETMKHSLWQLIRYLQLVGVNCEQLWEEYYQAGILPCKDKKEGKNRIDEIKRKYSS